MTTEARPAGVNVRPDDRKGLTRPSTCLRGVRATGSRRRASLESHLTAPPRSRWRREGVTSLSQVPTLLPGLRCLGVSASIGLKYLSFFVSCLRKSSPLTLEGVFVASLYKNLVLKDHLYGRWGGHPAGLDGITGVTPPVRHPPLPDSGDPDTSGLSTGVSRSPHSL